MTATHPVDSAPPPVQRARPLGIAAVGALAALCYGVLVGGTTLSELDATLRLLTAAVAGLFVLVYVLKAPGQADRVDQGVLLALLFLVGAAVMSQFPRQSFDAALGALALTAILFIARGQLAREEPRIVFIRVLVGLSALLTAITAARWLSEALAWWSLTNWTVVPPLNLNLSSVPWGHRHDLTLLLAMLYPAWWMGNPAPIRRAAAAVVGGLTILIVIVDGSRMLWLAMAVATAVLLVPPLFRWLQRRGWSPFVMISALVVAAGMLAAVGLRIGIVDRLLNLESLAWRSEMWVALFDTWLAHPIAGLGPGSFPWVLQQTDYFVTNSWAPRHPDSVFFQLIAEAGILGIAALGTLVITLGLAVFRGRSTAAAWALTTFAVAGLGSNPTDFGFLLVLAVGWAAYAVPRDRGAAGQGERRFSPTRAITLTALAVVGAAYTMTLAAGFAYEAARREVTGGDFPQARAPLDAAIALDPGLALYPRQRGTLSYVEGNAAAGIPDLEWATQLNPSDDLAWRTLALAYASVGDQDAAESALDKAVSDQRSDPSNMLLSAYWHGRDGRTSEARAILAELVRAWPATVAAVGWSDILPTSITTTQVIDDAVERWLQGSPYPESFSGQGIWLAVLGSRPDLLDVAIDELGVSDGLANATIAVFTCDPQGGIYLDQLAESDRRTQLYWHLRLRDSARNGSPDEGAARIIGITSGDPIDFARSVETLNPLLENGWAGFSADIWGYRRWWIEWPADEIQLPDPEAGAIRWLLDPAGATRDAGLEDRLPGCA